MSKTTPAPSPEEETDKVAGAIQDWKRERPDLTNLRPMAIFGRLSRITGMQRSIFNARHDAAGLSLAAFDVLANLRRSGVSSQKTARELAESSMLSSGGISLRLDRMETDGLVERRRDTGDRRVVYTSLSERGRETIDALYGQHLTAQEALLAGLTPDEVSELDRLLRKLETSIEANSQAALSVPVSTEPDAGSSA